MTGDNRYSKLSDEELLHTFRKTGDNLWLGQLLQRYTTLLLGVAMKYLKDRDSAEDAVQQVFLKVLTHIPKEEINNFKGWLYILMRNHCLQLLRDKTYNTDTEVLNGIAAPVNEHEALKAHEYTLQQMEEGIELLHEEQRVTITLFYLHKKSYEQITAETGYSFMQVKSFIQNGKRNLKMILLKKLSESDHER